MRKLTNIIKLSFVAVSVLSISFVSLAAQDMPSRGPIPFSEYDANRDGFISENEFNDARAKRVSARANQGMPMRNAANAPDFSFFDVDKNGKISKTELLEGQNRQMLKNRAERNFKQRSARNNMPTFESFDLNGDGYLTKSESDKAKAYRMQARQSQKEIEEESCLIGEFSDIDLNSDGKITKHEFILNQDKAGAK